MHTVLDHGLHQFLVGHGLAEAVEFGLELVTLSECLEFFFDDLADLSVRRGTSRVRKLAGPEDRGGGGQWAGWETAGLVRWAEVAIIILYSMEGQA